MKNLKLLSLTMLMTLAGINLYPDNCKNENETRNRHAWNLLSVNGKEINLIRPSQIRVMTTEQVNILTNENLNAFSPEQIAAFPQALFESLSNEQFMSLDSIQLNAVLKYLNQKLVAMIKPERLNNLIKLWKPVGINTSITQDQRTVIQLLTQPQIANLSKESLAIVLNNLSDMQMTFISVKNLSNEQLLSLTRKQVQAMTPAQIKDLSIAQLSLSSGTPAVYLISKLSAAQIQMITAAQIQGLSINVVKAMTFEQVNALNADAKTAYYYVIGRV